MRGLRTVVMLMLCCAVVLGLVGCSPGGAETTTLAKATSTTAAPTTTTTAVTSAGETTTTAETATTPSDGAIPTTAPDSGATPDASAGTPGAITPEEIKNAMGANGMGSPEQLQVYDYKNFGHYAAAYVMAADENVYLVLFNDGTGGWAILCTYTGLDWEAVQADLRLKAAPEDLIEWANPEGD
jgi:hypothetical protein